MKGKSIFAVAAMFCAAVCFSQDVVIKKPDYFTEPIRDGHVLFPDSLVYPADATEIVIPDVGMFGRLDEYSQFPNLRKITFGNVDYLPGGLLYGIPNVEEVVFDGMVGHFDCTLILNCPKLKTIIFKGPISSTGGSGLVSKTPNLEKVVFESVVVDLGVEEDKIVNNGAFLKAYNDCLNPVATIEQLRTNPKLIADMERVARWQEEVMRAKDSKWMRKVAYSSAKILQSVLTELGSPLADSLKQSMEYAWNLGDDVKTKLEVLKESPSYGADTVQKPKFEYALPSDSLLTATREYFNLDSVAGDGDDISRIKNLLYWVHNSIPHAGDNGLAPGERTLRNTYESAKRDSCGYNCRALAISLAEALLVEGIPARYVTCQSKEWDTDNDCHVICTAWSESLGKWVWVDPTFAAYVTDENGTLLHPGEVRYRLQNDLPLILNKDANWNNRYTENKEYY
ncbi:MAG: transglutaminase domain-containing protein, partial [Muribaculaceae bacterium]|nr:transglutaminase domain-containing protein [Muribaculaceae bacterium]